MVKALSQKSRDLGLSPSRHSPFPAVRNCSRENYLFIIISNSRNNVVNDDRSSMCMCMRISSKEGDVHVHVHPIIFYACSAHVQCVKVLDQTHLSS